MTSTPTKPSAYVSREEFIVQRCRGKDVLHLGFLGETISSLDVRLEHVMTPNSLHSRLSRLAQSLVGVDLDQRAIDYLRDQGLTSVFAGNVEALEDSDVPRSSLFSTVVAGDIIEHLSNPGRMLESIKGFLDSNGELLLTTPNAFGLPNYLRFLRGSFQEGPDHVQSYSPFTLKNLLERHGWRVIEAYSCYQERAKQASGNLAFMVGKWLLERSPRLGGTLLVVCRPSDE
jgi:SAM-dependent methyltransferase